jgi:hypothetical protein
VEEVAVIGMLVLFKRELLIQVEVAEVLVLKINQQVDEMVVLV